MQVRTATVRRQPPGFALLIVLWFLVLLAATGGWILSTSRSETSLARNVLAAAAAEAMADAGVAQAVFHLTAVQPDQQWLPDGGTHKIATSRGEILIEIEDEAGKINPNLASETLLAALYKVLGVDSSRAGQLGAAITDWVSKEDKGHTAAALHDQYQEAGLSSLPPHAPITDLDTLGHVIGMTPDILDRARFYLTVYTDTANPGGKFIASPVTKAVALARTSQPQTHQEENRMATSAIGMSAGSYKGNKTTGDPSLEDGAPKDQITATLRIIAKSKTGGIFVRRAVIRTKPANEKGYSILEWQHGNLTEMNIAGIR